MKPLGCMQLYIHFYAAGFHLHCRAVDHVVERCFDGYNMQLEDTAENRRNVREALIPVTNAEGIVHEQVQTKAAWIYWDVTIK